MNWRRIVVILPPYAWLALFFFVPFLIVLKISLAEQAMGIPPYTPLIANGGIQATGANYQFLFSDSLYARAYLNALGYAAGATLGCLLIGYPLAYAIVRAPLRWRNGLLLLVILPFWTSFLICVYAWIGLLKSNGLINNILMQIGLIHAPLPLINNSFAIYIGLIYSYLPYMVLPLYAALEKLDPALLEAASDLGCRPSQAFWRVTLPLSLPGWSRAPPRLHPDVVGEFVIPDFSAGRDLHYRPRILGRVFHQPRLAVASAVAFAMLVLLVAPMGVAARAT